MRNWKKSAAIAVTGVVAALSLSGCLRIEADVYVGPEAQVEGLTATLAVNKDLPAGFGSTLGMSDSSSMPEFTLDDFKQQAIGEQPELEKYCAFEETATEYVAKCDSPPSELSTLLTGEDGDPTLSMEDGVITVTQPTEKSEPAMNMFNMKATISYHFPGEVQSVSGSGVTIDPSNSKVAVVDMMAGDGNPVIIKASNGETSAGIFVPILMGGLLVGFLVVALVAYKMGTRGRSEEILAVIPSGDPLDLSDTTEIVDVVDDPEAPEER